MKKYAIVFAIGAIATFASCGENKETSSQEQIDSAVEARTAAMEAEMNAHNDSLINAMAAMKADSAARADSMAALNAGKTVTTTTHSVTKTKITKPATKKPETIGEGKPKMGDKDQAKKPTNTVGEGKPKMGEK